MDDEDLDEIPFGVDGADLIPDSETEDRDRLELRAEALGFRPQKEVIHNFLLPYSDKVQKCILLWILNCILSWICSALNHLKLSVCKFFLMLLPESEFLF